jgi:hypothetical protein
MLELESVAILFIEVMICARAPMVEKAVAVKSRDSMEALNTSGASRRSQRDPQDRLGL